jgi:predicted MFS family arabinose efflux permease
MYTYFSVIFDRVTHGDTLILGLLLVLWGFSGTIMNLVGGRLIDTIGTRKVLAMVLVALIAVTATLSWTSAFLATAIVAIMVHGATSWGQLAAQQHRLVSVMPKAGPIVLGLNTSATYVGVASAGIIGAASLTLIGAHNIGWVSLVLYVGALIAAEITHRVITNGSISAQASGGAGAAALATT